MARVRLKLKYPKGPNWKEKNDLRAADLKKKSSRATVDGTNLEARHISLNVIIFVHLDYRKSSFFSK